MDDAQRKELKKKIKLEMASTEENIAELKEITKPIAPENAIGRISRMDAINNKSVNEAALREAENKLKKLEIAISKVDEDPGFGTCARCGKDIPEGRLMLMPHAAFCVTCADR